MQIEGTTDNAAWAAAVMDRVKSEARMISAKAALWRLAGTGLLGIGIGAGVGIAAGLAFVGYSYITDSQASATKIADAISKAMDRITIKAEGTVKLADGGEVELKSGGEVSIRQGGTVRIDPNSTVRLDGRVADGASRPTREQMRSAAAPPSSTNIVTDYVIFKNVAFGKGRVETGWHYNDNEQTNPDR